MQYDSFSSLRARLWARRNLNPLMERGSRWLSPTAWLQGREVMFQNIVHRDLARLGIDEAFYPLRSVANYSYFYLLLRLVQTVPGLNILELGGGQSTILLDRLARQFPLANTTLEHDRQWSEWVGNQVKSDLIHAPLASRTVRGHRAETYGTECLPNDFRCNVLLVDGPRRTRRRSRWSALEFIERHLEPEFLILFDDAERRGEIQTIAEALKLLDEQGVRYGTNLVRSINSQFLIATPGFQAALYF